MLDYQQSDAGSFTTYSRNSLSIIRESSAEDYTISATPSSLQRFSGGNTYNQHQDQINNIWQYSIAQKENVEPNAVGSSQRMIKTHKKQAAHDSSHQAKLSVLSQMRVFKVFQAWKLLSPALNYNQQIQREKEEIKSGLRLKFACFREWKNASIKQNRAKQYYRKRIYRTFFMTCSQLLQLRLRALYLQEFLKLNQYPVFLQLLKGHHAELCEKSEKMMQKQNFKRLLKRMKKIKMRRNAMKLASLQHQLNLKKKCWRILQPAQ